MKSQASSLLLAALFVSTSPLALAEGEAEPSTPAPAEAGPETPSDPDAAKPATAPGHAASGDNEHTPPAPDSSNTGTAPAADAADAQDEAPVAAENSESAGEADDSSATTESSEISAQPAADVGAGESVADGSSGNEVPQAESASASASASPAPPGTYVDFGNGMQFRLGGYYQTRFRSFLNFFQAEDGGADMGNPGYVAHRLKLEPSFHVGDWASLSMDLDGLRGVLWGDNAGLASTALFAANPSDTAVDGFDLDSIALKRLWAEFKVPVGIVRMGRMANQWGMGILANDGNGFDDLFGDNENRTTFDRLLFATRPIAIVQKALGQEDSKIPFIFALAYDRLVDDPMATYYGDCRAGLTKDDAQFSTRCDQDGDGITEDLAVTDENRTAADRQPNWWGDNADDVYEVVYVVIYKGNDTELFGEKGDLIAGSYVANRIQESTSSSVWIADAYIKANFFNTHLEFEIANILGDTRALTIPNINRDSDQYARQANILGYAGRIGYELGPLQLWMEHGHASGDGDIFDENFTGRALNPDFNVGLLLYDEILARVSANNSLSPALGSRGGVYNSYYLFPNIRYNLNPDWQLVGAFLFAWPDQPDADSIRCSADDESARCKEFVQRAAPEDIATSPYLGWEADLALKGTFSKKMRFSLEGAVANVTDRVPVQKAGLSEEPFYYTLQMRLAYDFSL